MRLDSKDSFPTGMEQYLSYYGWHFSKAMCDWAVSMMYKRNAANKKEYIQPLTKEQVNTLLNNQNIKINDSTYDYVYIANMCKADFLGSSIADDKHWALYIKDVIDDQDSYEEMPFTRFYADCIGKGIPIYWEDML